MGIDEVQLDNLFRTKCPEPLKRLAMVPNKVCSGLSYFSFLGHWLLMDAMGMGLCVAFIAFVRLPSLKVSTLLLSGLLLYDVFWVFFSQYVFNANVMVKVATR